MNKIYLDPEIYYFENVLSQKDLNIVQNFVKDNNGWYSAESAYSSQDDGFVNNQIKEMNEEISNIFLVSILVKFDVKVSFICLILSI